MSKLLSRLTRFYKEQEARLPHDPAFLFDLAWDLAEVIEDYGYDDIDVTDLKRKYTVTLIDTAVNVLHQNLLNSQHEDTGVMISFAQGDIAEYLLHREDDQFWQDAENWHHEEERREEELAASEEAYWSKVERLALGEW